jgi:AmiR/NasT family two-component response regulator
MSKERRKVILSGPSTFAVPQILRDLRSLKICVFNPPDQDGEELTRQLERIGCQVQAFWPALPEPPQGTDLVFIALTPEMSKQKFEWCTAEEAPPVIAIVAYENPTIIDAMLRTGAKAVIASPVRSFGLLSALVLARELTSVAKKQNKRIARLESKLAGIRVLGEAQDILCKQYDIDKENAYRLIRQQAMSKRVTAEEIALAIVNAKEVLSFKNDSATGKCLARK